MAAGSLGALYALNRQVYGTAVALLSVVLMAVLPGAAFFDVWVKQDLLVILPGLLALHFFIRRCPIRAGLLLGLAFLAKHMALFYAGALFLMWATSRDWRRPRCLLVPAGVSFVVGGWWYLLNLRRTLNFLGFAAGRSNSLDWAKGRGFLLAQLWHDLAGVGAVLAAAGLVVLLARAVGELRTRREEPEHDHLSNAPLWPLMLTLPPLVLIALSAGKTPWYVITILPGLATLAAVALAALSGTLASTVPGFEGRQAQVVAAVAAAILAGGTAWTASRSYNHFLQRADAPFAYGTTLSRDMAAALNERVQEGEKVIITPLNHWTGGMDQRPCPIFMYYLDPMPLSVMPRTASVDALLATARQRNADWILVSPPKPKRPRMVQAFRRQGCRVHVLPGGLITSVSERKPPPDQASP